MTITTQHPDTQEHFAAQVRDALSGMKKDEAAAFIAKLHAADVDALSDRLAAATDETRHAIADATTKHHLLEAVTGSVAREVLRAAQLQARNALAARVLGMIGALARQSEDGTVDAQIILETLTTPLPRIPFRPHIAAFYPDNRYTHGHFASDDGAVTQVWPFAGWALVVMDNDAPRDRLQPVFYVDGEAVPERTLVLERGIKLRKMT